MMQTRGAPRKQCASVRPWWTANRQSLEYLFQPSLDLEGNKTAFGSTAGVGDSFGFVCHIRDKLGIPGPVHVHKLILRLFS